MLTASTIVLMMEAVSTSETLVNFYQTTWHNIPEGSHFHATNSLKLWSNLQSVFMMANLIPS
jgi:hypothetical protein